MNDNGNSFLKTSRFLLKVCGVIIVVYLVFGIIVPSSLNALSAASSAKQQEFLKPRLWDTNTLDPAKTNFSTVILSGMCELNANGYAPISDPFEIAMCGDNLYFKRRWETFHGGWYWNVEMAVTNFYSNISIKWRGYGSGGGGSSGDNAKQKLFPGRRLWSGTNFLCASADSLKFTNGTGFSMESEEFSDFKKIGPYLIPQKIVFVDWEKHRWTYQIKKIQFCNEPSASWFLEKAKRFGYPPRGEQKFQSQQSNIKTNN